jgi:hypothetical protein
LTPAGIHRAPDGSLIGLVADYDVVTACGITADHIWWCECGLVVSGSGRYIWSADVCAHLRALGRTPARETGP